MSTEQEHAELQAAGGFKVKRLDDLPPRMQARLRAKKAEQSNPKAQLTEYDELTW